MRRTHAAAGSERTPPEPIGTAGGVTTLVRTVGFPIGRVPSVTLGGLPAAVVALVVITVPGVACPAVD